MIRITHIISGGQTGVDRAALDFSIEMDIPHSGFCPNGRWAEDGIIDKRYQLTETQEEDPKFRTKLNVINSDATLIIFDSKDEGTQLTIDLCSEFQKPIFIIELSKKHSKTAFQNCLDLPDISRLNIAGPRESNNPGIYLKAYELLKKMIL